MKVIQSRIRGLGRTMDGGWFTLDPHLSLFHFPDDIGRAGFFQALETVNPPYSCRTAQPFVDFPQFTEQRGYQRRINAAKRTVAIAVFNTTPALVNDLAAIDPLFFSTDRIEAGRRLDYSRWINFVELAASSRWSEISAEIFRLLELCRAAAPDEAERLAGLLKALRPSDRITGELQHQLAHWLQNLPPELTADTPQQNGELLTTILRADHFQAARGIITRRLPLFIALGIDPPPGLPPAPPAEGTLAKLLSLIRNKVENGKDPAFLEALNDRLADMPFTAIAPRLVRTPTGPALLPGPGHRRESSPGPASALAALQTATLLAIALSHVVCQTEPVLLFDSPERFLPPARHQELAEFIKHIAKTCQCLYGYKDLDIFPQHQEIKRYRAGDIESGFANAVAKGIRSILRQPPPAGNRRLSP